MYDAPPRALLVEDEGLVALLLEDHLHDMGIVQVRIATTLTAGLREADNAEIDFAVLDVNLDSERSDPIADRLLARNVPFVFSTGYGREGIAQRHAACPCIVKPPQFHELRQVIDVLLGPEPDEDDPSRP